jgi:heptosyltransferase-2
VPNSFLIIQTAFIGDVVLATALVEKLHQQYPDAHIDFLLRKGNETLLKGHPFLRQVLIWDKRNGKLKNLIGLLRQIRGQRYDAVINVQRFFATGLLTACSGAKERIGFDKNPLHLLFTRSIPHGGLIATGHLHETERNQRLIAHLTDDRPAKPRLYPSEADRTAISAYQTEPYICVAPSSVWFTKQLPVETWAAFVNEAQHEYQVFLIAGPNDHAVCEQVRTQAGGGSRITNLAGELSLLQSVALQAGAKMNVVNDSGPLHFASATDAPVTAVFCSTVPAFGYGPLSTISHIVEVEEPLACRPCGIHGKKECPKGHFNCGRNIRVRQLLQHLPA